MFKRLIIVLSVCVFLLGWATKAETDNVVEEVAATDSSVGDKDAEKYVPKVIIEAKWGNGPGEFGYLNTNTGGLEDRGPMAIFVFRNEISILDNINRRISVYSTGGNFIKNIDLTKLPRYNGTDVSQDLDAIISINHTSTALARDNLGNIYIVGQVNYWNKITKRSHGLGKTILKFDASGNLISRIFTSPIKKDTVTILPNAPELEKAGKNGYSGIRGFDTLRRIESIDIYPKLNVKADSLIFWSEGEEEYKISKDNGTILKKFRLKQDSLITIKNLLDNRFLKKYPYSIKSVTGLDEAMREFIFNARVLLELMPVLDVDKNGNIYELIWSPDYKEKGVIVVKWEKKL